VARPLRSVNVVVLNLRHEDRSSGVHTAGAGAESWKSPNCCRNPPDGPGREYNWRGGEMPRRQAAGRQAGGPKMRTDHCRFAGGITMGAASAVLVPVETLPSPATVNDLSFHREVAPRAFGEEILVQTLTLDAGHGALLGANQFRPNMLGFACKLQIGIDARLPGSIRGTSGIPA